MITRNVKQNTSISGSSMSGNVNNGTAINSNIHYNQNGEKFSSLKKIFSDATQTTIQNYTLTIGDKYMFVSVCNSSSNYGGKIIAGGNIIQVDYLRTIGAARTFSQIVVATEEHFTLNNNEGYFALFHFE